MAFENLALKAWLRQVGNTRRKTILAKLKKDLEERGLTREEVYKGLLQLIVRSPSVRLTRCRTLGYPRHRSAHSSDIEDRHELSSSKNIQSNTIDLRSPRTPSRSATQRHRCEPGAAERLKIDDDSTAAKIPELLDERVGNGSPIIIRIQRNAITLNLTSFSPASAKKDPLQVRPSPEIRLADSSVPDVVLSVDKVTEEKRDSRRVTKKPKIIEDVTCLDGTMFAGSAVKKYSENATKKSKRKKSPELRATTEKTETIVGPEKQVRLRKKLRKIFGNDLTLSESDEEKRLIAEKLMPRKRRKESRMSSDSGVCMNDVTSDLILSEIQEKGKEQNRLGEFSSIEAEKNKLSEPLVRSMPLLDRAAFDKCQDETHGEALPDSSTNSEEKIIEVMPDSSSTGKLTILVTPVHAEDNNVFDRQYLEIDVANGKLISTPTSTTTSLPLAETIKEEKCFEDMENLVGMDVTKGCQISTQDNQINIQEDVPSPNAEIGIDEEHRLIIDDSSIAGDSETSQSQRDCGASNSSGPKISDCSEKSNEKENDLDGRNFTKNELTSSNTVDVNSASKLPAALGESRNETADGSKNSCDMIQSSEMNQVNNNAALELPGNLSVTCETADAIVANDLPEKLESNTIEIDSAREPNAVVQSDQASASNNRTENLEHSAIRPQPINRSEDPPLVGEEAPECQLPTCVAELQKTKEIPNAPKFRVLHPSELGARWCPTPVDANVVQSQPQLPPNPSILQLSSNSLAPQQPSSSAMLQLPLQPFIVQHPPYSFIPQNSFYVAIPNLPLHSSITQSAPANVFQNPRTSPLNELQLLVSKAPAPSTLGAGDSTYPNSSSFCLPQPAPPLAFIPSGQYDVTKQNVPQPSTTSSTPNTANSSPTNPGRMTENDIMFTILEHLLGLKWCIERVMTETNMFNYFLIDLDFTEKRSKLIAELEKYAAILGTRNLPTIATQILKHYELLMPPDKRILNMQKILFIFQQKELPPPNYRSPATSIPIPALNTASNPQAPPPHRLARPSPPRNSVFTGSQLRRLYEQIAAYQKLTIVLHYQLLVQQGIPAPKPKATRRRNQKKPSPAPAQTDNLAAGNVFQPTVATSVDHQMNTQRAIDDSSQRTIYKAPNVINTGPQLSTNENVAEIVSDIYRLHPEEKSSAQNAVIERNVQNDTADGHVRDQIIASQVKDQIIAKQIQDEVIARAIQEKTTAKGVQDQTIVENVQVQTTAINVQDKTVEGNVKVTTGDQDNTIEKDIATVDPSNGTSSSFQEHGHTSVIDVLKELEIFDLITNGPVSTSTKGRTGVQVPASMAEDKCSKATNSTYPENSTSFPTTLTDSAENFDGATTESEKQDIPRDSAISEDVETNVESSREVSVITIEDDYDYAGSCDLAATTAGDVVKTEEFSILEVKSISRDVFNSMGEMVDPTASVQHMEDAQVDEDESEEEFSDVAMRDCFLCGRQSSVVCEQCRSAFYCSPQCHQQHWESTHHIDCEPVAQESSQAEETLAEH